jgi:hypothetical protein
MRLDLFLVQFIPRQHSGSVQYTTREDGSAGGRFVADLLRKSIRDGFLKRWVTYLLPESQSHKIPVGSCRPGRVNIRVHIV